MSNYNMNFTLENIRMLTIMFVDIFIMWLILYYAIKIVRSNAKTKQIFKGILLIVLVDMIAKVFGLKTLAYFADIFINWGFLAIIIIFQPEIRSLLERIGKSNVFSRITTLTGNEKENLVDQIVTAVMLLSQDQTGALISIEQSHSLEDFIATGTRLNSDVTAELLTSIFVTSTPLHDGAVIIQGDKIACASAYFPPTNLELPGRFGARHRAAIGISEITDAVTIVVSEETGTISITQNGKIQNVNRKQLRDYLLRVICGEETEVKATRHKLNNESARTVVIAEDKSDKNKEGTGFMSRLAIKKQAPKETKIEVEEVIPAETSEENDRIAEEAATIKLPHKKNRPAPSYPTQSRKEQERAEAAAKLEAVEAEKRAAVEARKRALEEEALRKQQEEERRAMELAEAEAAAAKAKAEAEEQARQEAMSHTAQHRRMTSDEVMAAREAMRAKLGGKSEEETPVEVSEPASIEEPEQEPVHTEFDTTKLDLSKIMGMNDDLERTFEMIDSISDQKSDDASSNEEGGDR